MKRFKAVKNVTKEVVASLEISALCVKQDWELINSWLRDMTNNECSCHLEQKPMGNLYKLCYHLTKDWVVQRVINEDSDTIYVVKISHGKAIGELEESAFAELQANIDCELL